jgi:ABC-2 type transport system permease protein
MSSARTLRIFAAETKYELLKYWRLPGYAVPVIVFPLMFYAIFGLAFRRAEGATVGTYLIATMGAFGVIGASMFGLGVGVATERGQGWMTVKRASPMPPAVYFAAKVAVAMVFSLVIVLLLFALGYLFGSVRLAAGQWAALAVALVLGAAPFCALGLAVGYLAGPNSAQAITNLIYLPMSFASGLWMPLNLLPRFVGVAAHYLPAYHLAQLAFATTGISPEPAVPHALALSIFTVMFLGLAAIGFTRDEGRTYG